MPKKGKKGGGGKQGKEDQMEQRAQAKEELNKKKEETLTLFAKDKLEKEDRNTTINLLKLNQAWRTILCQTRHAELRDDITVFGQTFEMNLKSVDSLIKCLVHDLEDAELWEGQARSSQLHHVGCLQVLQEKRLRILLQQWERGLREVDFTLAKERQQISAESEQQCARLEDVTFELQRQQHEVEAELQHMYDDIRAAYQCAHQTRIAEIQEQHEHNLGLTEVQNREWISSEQPKKPNPIQNGSEVKDSDVKKLQDAISQLKKTLNSSDRESEMAGADLRAAKDEVAQKTRKLQAEMTQSHKMARKQLTELTIYSSDAIKKLQADVAEGERILRLAKMCLKRENEQEKVLPSSISSLSTEHQSHEGLTEERAMVVSSMYPEVEKMWQCYNTCVLQRKALRKQREHLIHENQQLQVLLCQHLNAMTVSEPQTLQQQHGPLPPVCQAPKNPVAVRAHPDRQQICHTVIEAVHVVKYTQ